MKPLPKHKLAFYIVMLFFGLLYITMSVANHYFFRTTDFDYGPYGYAFWDYAHFRITPCPLYKVFVHNDINFLQDHFSLTLMYLVPFYWLLNWLTGTYTLLFLQNAFILWGAWATYKLIELKAKDSWLAVGAVIYYFLLQGRFSAFQEDCNIITMCSCFVPVFLWYFESKRFIAAAIVFILALFSREDMPLWFVFIPIVPIIWHWKEKKLVYAGLAYMLASMAGFVLIFKLLIPLVQSKTNPYNLFNYNALGGTPSDVILFMLKHPIDTIGLLFRNQSGDATFDGVKTEFYLVYLISGAFVLFFRPQYLIWFIPPIVQRMFNDVPIRWSIETYYAVQIVTLLPLSVFLVLGHIKSTKIKYLFAVLVSVLALSVTCYKANPAHRKLGYGDPVKSNILDKAFFNPPYNVKNIRHALDLIPANARVSASASILHHLVQRKYIYQFPDVEDAEYIAAFTFPDFFDITPTQYQDSLCRNYLLSGNWEITASDTSFVLLKKLHGQRKELKYDSIVCTAETMNNDSKHLIASDGELLENDSVTWNSERVHSGKHSVKLTKEHSYGMNIHPMNVVHGDILYISIWRYSENKGDGMLLASTGKGFYLPSSASVAKDSNGWEQLVIYCIVPEDYKDLKVYVWDNGEKPVWFDDLKIQKYAIKTGL